MRWLPTCLALLAACGSTAAPIDAGRMDAGAGRDAGPDLAGCDRDGDGHEAAMCGGDDCDDGHYAVSPSATELCNGIDDDCDGATDEGLLILYRPDCDGDGYGAFTGEILECALPTTPPACALPGGAWVMTPDDCDDAAPAVHPGADEICDGADDDCDGHGDHGSCSGPATRVAAGNNRGCLVRTTGQLWCWGRNAGGQIGDGSTADRSTPARAGTLSTVVDVAVGGNVACAILADGTLDCWGDGTFGQLGDGTTRLHTMPAPVPSLTNVVDVASGSNVTCAVDSVGVVSCWGSDMYGGLGDRGATTSAACSDCSAVPVVVPLPSAAVEVSVGSFHACARLATGEVSCWGSNDVGELGDGLVTHGATCGVRDCAVPVLVSGLADAVELATLGAGTTTCARRATGAVVCWGNAAGGILGDGRATHTACGSGDCAPAPVTVSGIGDATQIGVGVGHACALSTSRGALCWGANGFGQLGDGTTTDRATPVAVTGITDAAELAVGGNHTCIRRATSVLACWGSNNYGQLGDGTMVDHATPMAVVDP